MLTYWEPATRIKASAKKQASYALHERMTPHWEPLRRLWQELKSHQWPLWLTCITLQSHGGFRETVNDGPSPTRGNLELAHDVSAKSARHWSVFRDNFESFGSTSVQAVCSSSLRCRAAIDEDYHKKQNVYSWTCLLKPKRTKIRYHIQEEPKQRQLTLFTALQILSVQPCCKDKRSFIYMEEANCVSDCIKYRQRMQVLSRRCEAELGIQWNQATNIHLLFFFKKQQKGTFIYRHKITQLNAI